MHAHITRRVTLVALAFAVVFSTFAPAAFSVEALDSYEGTLGDDTPARARDITGYFAPSTDAHWFGSTPRIEGHDFGWVLDSTTPTMTPESDEDWVKFEFTAADDEFSESYLFEAIAKDPLVDPVIEVYGPNDADPTRPGDLVASSEATRVTELDPAAIAANDDGPWFSDRSASVSFVPTDHGWYFVRVRPYYQYDNGIDQPGFRDGIGPYLLRYKVGQTTRVAGADRIATAVAVSKERYPSYGPDQKSAVLASAYSFPDALSGSTLAGAIDGPMLLTSGSALSSATRDEIARLGLDTVYLLGGTGALSSAVEQAVKSISVTSTRTVEVVRVGGVNRADTARLVALEAAKHTQTSHLAFVANSKKFPDALAASPMAAYNNAPVLLTSGTGLSAEAAAALSDPRLGITDVVIVGGTGVVSTTVQNQIVSRIGGSAGNVKRIGGVNRYATARDFAVWATGWEAGADPGDHVSMVGTASNPNLLGTLDFDRIALASGTNFPDALSGGPFAGAARAPVLLTKSSEMSEYVLDYLDVSPIGSRHDYYGAAPYEMKRSYVIGGSSAVDDTVFRIWDLWTGPGPY